MRSPHIIDGKNPPPPLTVLGEKVLIFGQGDLSKPFEVHIQEGKEGGGPPPHHHPWDEAFFVLEGSVEVSIDGDAQTLGRGSYVHIPADTVHAYTNKSEKTILLAVVSDSRGGKLFEALDSVSDRLPEDTALLNDIAGKLNVHFIT